MKQLIIGIGTGRCGTLSLCTLLNRHEECCVSHELRPLPNIENEPPEKILAKFQGIIDRSERPICGDIAFFHLWYLTDILDHFDLAKVIVLKRHKEPTIQSYLNKIKEWPGKKPVNHWAGIDREKFSDSEFDQCFPKYKTADPAEGIARYYDTYYEIVESLMSIYPLRMRLIKTETFFQDPDQINEIFDWLRIKKEGRNTDLIHEHNRRRIKRQ